MVVRIDVIPLLERRIRSLIKRIGIVCIRHKIAPGILVGIGHVLVDFRTERLSCGYTVIGIWIQVVNGDEGWVLKFRVGFTVGVHLIGHAHVVVQKGSNHLARFSVACQRISIHHIAYEYSIPTFVGIGLSAIGQSRSVLASGTPIQRLIKAVHGLLWRIIRQPVWCLAKRKDGDHQSGVNRKVLSQSHQGSAVVSRRVAVNGFWTKHGIKMPFEIAWCSLFPGWLYSFLH